MQSPRSQAPDTPIHGVPSVRETVRSHLQRVAHVLDLDALVLVDDDGLELASVGDGYLCQLLAESVDRDEWVSARASGELVMVLRSHHGGPIGKAPQVAATRLKLPSVNRSFRLLALGASPFLDVALEHASRGLERICGGTRLNVVAARG